MTRFAVYGIAAALIVGALAVALLKGRGTNERPDAQYLAAAARLEAGRFIARHTVECRPLPPRNGQTPLPDTATLLECSEKTRAMLSEVVPRVSLNVGDYLTHEALVKPADADFLPSVLKPGFRAVAIMVTDVTGGAGLYRPGNFVDVLITVSSKQRRGDKNIPPLSKTLLQAVRILAVDRDMGVPGANGKPDARDNRKKSGTVTLEVLPKDAEVLALGGTMGELSLALRSGAADETPRADGSSTLTDDVVASSPEEKNIAGIKTIYGTMQTQHDADQAR